jgi:hypothetical protein
VRAVASADVQIASSCDIQAVGANSNGEVAARVERVVGNDEEAMSELAEPGEESVGAGDPMVLATSTPSMSSSQERVCWRVTAGADLRRRIRSAS